MGSISQRELNQYRLQSLELPFKPANPPFHEAEAYVKPRWDRFIGDFEGTSVESILRQRKDAYERDIRKLDSVVKLYAKLQNWYADLSRELKTLAGKCGWQTTCGELEELYYKLYYGAKFSDRAVPGTRFWKQREIWSTDVVGKDLSPNHINEFSKLDIGSNLRLDQVVFDPSVEHDSDMEGLTGFVWERDWSIDKIHGEVMSNHDDAKLDKEAKKKELDIVRFNLSLANRMLLELTEFGEVSTWEGERAMEDSSEASENRSDDPSSWPPQELVHALTDNSRRLRFIDEFMVDKGGTQATWQSRTDRLLALWEKAGLRPEKVPYKGDPKKMMRAYNNYRNRKRKRRVVTP